MLCHVLLAILGWRWLLFLNAAWARIAFNHFNARPQTQFLTEVLLMSGDCYSYSRRFKSNMTWPRVYLRIKLNELRMEVCKNSRRSRVHIKNKRKLPNIPTVFWFTILDNKGNHKFCLWLGLEGESNRIRPIQIKYMMLIICFSPPGK